MFQNFNTLLNINTIDFTEKVMLSKINVLKILMIVYGLVFYEGNDQTDMRLWIRILLIDPQ
jgi:hypothetical protein